MKLNKLIHVALFLGICFAATQTIAQLGKTKISLSQFQNYVDVQKFITDKESVSDLLKQQKIDLNNVLTRYLDQQILLLNAKKKGIDASNSLVKQRYEQTYLKWIGQIYTLKHVDLPSNEVKESELKAIYKQYKKGNKSFDSLNDQEKSGLYRLVLLQNLQKARASYQKKLEKKYKVSRKKISSKLVAEVSGQDITKKDLDSILESQLANFGLTIEQAKQNNPKQYDKIVSEAREELIFDKLIQLDMKKNNFLKKKLVKEALNGYKEQLIIETFMQLELIPKIKISDSELDAAFQELSRNRPQIQQLVPTEQEKVLRRFIFQRKQPQILSSYLTEKKEEIIIKRNKDLLTKIT